MGKSTRLQRDGQETACLLFRALFLTWPGRCAPGGLHGVRESTQDGRTGQKQSQSAHVSRWASMRFCAVETEDKRVFENAGP